MLAPNFLLVLDRKLQLLCVVQNIIKFQVQPVEEKFKIYFKLTHNIG